MKNFNTKTLTYSALLTALVYIGTRIALPLSFNGGYIHIGDGFVLLCGVILGPIGGLAAGIGSALADILSGYSAYALPTFIIKFLMAFIVGILIKYKNNKRLSLIFGITYSIIWISFLIPLKASLKSTLADHLDSFFVELSSDAIATPNYLLSLGKAYDSILLIFIILVPLLIGLFFFLNERGALNFKPIEGISFIIAGTLMIILYYFTAVIMYGNYITPIMDIVPNLIQFILGIVIVNLLYPISQRINLT